ncbi:MAG: LuxR family transcriptional regulator, partial [Thermoleophilia bacterium]|nr:LuxR family transcriptional regulator [Thermoleophilia bacterium]
MAALEGILERARAGAGATVVVRGEPGAGKTRIADELAARSGGFRVLRARGWQLESGMPFAAVGDLVEPIRDAAAGLPPPAREALAGALGHGPPVPADRFAVSGALTALLRGAAARSPLLVIVDDADWLDLASCDALAFASRRLAGAPVVFVAMVAGRRLIPLLEHAVEIRLGGLGAADALALVGARTPAPVDPAVAGRLCAATGGNPLALAEAAARLTPDELAGRHPLPEPLPLSHGVAAEFARRAAALPPPVRRLLLLTAAAGPQAAAALPAAARAEGLDLAALEAAERDGLVRLGPPGPCFVHPLMRSAVYFAADPGERRAAHRALAAALAAAGAPELAASHLADAALAPDEDAARALDIAARAAESRSASGVAAVAHERAAALSPHPEDRAARLLSAARAWMLAGRLERAAGLADGAALDAGPGRVRFEARRTAGRLALLRGSARTASEILLAEADAAGQPDARVAALLAEATVALIAQGAFRAALATARRAEAAAGRAGDAGVARTARLAVAVALLMTGRGREATPILVAGVAEAGHVAPAADGDAVAVLALRALVWAGETERAEPLLSSRIAALRGAGALGHLGQPLAAQLEIDLRTGRWGALAGRAEEVLAIGRDTGQGHLLFTALRDLATVAAAQGREEDCRALVDELTRVSGSSDLASRLAVLRVLGFLDLGLGRAARAVGHLEEAAWIARGGYGLREPNVERYAPDLVEACLRAGHPEAAARELAALEREARWSTAAWTHGALARCRGMLGAGGEADAHFAEALARHAEAGEPFERARTELAMGERRRRLRRRARAREPLESALATFTRLGAAPWADRARAELAAAGAAGVTAAPPVPAAPAPAAAGVMTPQERRLARLVASGATNREVAASVHLSTKTVEEHLSRL